MAQHHKQQTEVAWAAGLFDGEGCILLTPIGAKVLTVDMIHPMAIWQLNRILGGQVYQYTRKLGVVYRWVARGDETTRVLEMLLPYLTTKAAEAKVLLQYTAFQRDNVHRGQPRSKGAIKALTRARAQLSGMKGRRNGRPK